MDWQPIETAPRDGTWVLLAGGDTEEGDWVYEKEVDDANKRPVVGCWVKPPHPHYRDDESDDLVELDVWRFCFWDGSWRSHYVDPTHWAPLSPPSTKE